MMPRRTRHRWVRYGLFATVVFCCYLTFGFRIPFFQSEEIIYTIKAKLSPQPRPSPDFNSLTWPEEQCKFAFPGLTKDIGDMAALGPFTLKQAKNMGPLQARIQEGQLYLLHWEDSDVLDHEMTDRRTAALNQIHRALVTSPTPLPDTVFSLNVLDEAANDTWSYSRPAYTAPSPGNPPISRTFLMPLFAWWTWPLPFIGSVSRALGAIEAIESSTPFSKKDPRVVWRGTRRYNNAHHPHLRDDLLRVTKHAAWADVQELQWEDVGSGKQKKRISTNSLMIEEFCKYKYVLHTEGITFSGRFQFLQMCGSVLLTPPISWLQHTTHLVRPLFTSDLGLEGKAWVPSKGENEAWSTHYKPEEANILFVAPDWSDLEETINWLERHPKTAEGIARRQRKLFVERGYFSPAAEVCYWRALIRGWSQVVRASDQEWKKTSGIRWEAFALGHEK